MSKSIAGDADFYTFAMCRVHEGEKDGKGEVIPRWLEPTENEFDLDRVTHIISEVLAKPPQAMAWWGYRIAMQGIAALAPLEITEGATAEEVEKIVRETVGLDPNRTLDEAGNRGQAAHDVLEALALGDRPTAESIAETEYANDGTQHGRAVIAWWDAQGFDLTMVVSEKRLWSLRHGYAGSTDLAVLEQPGQAGTEIVDLKTHKPASGFTKPGFGPAYLSDLVQVRAYRIAWEEMGFGPTVGNRIIIARENGKWLEDRREVDPALWFTILEAYRIKVAFENP